MLGAVAATQRWRWVGDRALMRTFPAGAIEDTNRAALACSRELRTRNVPEVEDIVVGARSVLVVLRPGAEPPSVVTATLDRESAGDVPIEGRLFEIPVRYGGDDGPDLADVARHAGASEEEVVRTHAAVTYVVGFIGFSPGFPYLLGLDPRLATPRLDSPRTRVAVGSVGIGGRYTGIYPRGTAGGWRLIGRTDVELFDSGREPPALLEPGDRVRFLPR